MNQLEPYVHSPHDLPYIQDQPTIPHKTRQQINDKKATCQCLSEQHPLVKKYRLFKRAQQKRDFGFVTLSGFTKINFRINGNHHHHQEKTNKNIQLHRFLNKTVSKKKEENTPETIKQQRKQQGHKLPNIDHIRKHRSTQSISLGNKICPQAKTINLTIKQKQQNSYSISFFSKGTSFYTKKYDKKVNGKFKKIGLERIKEIKNVNREEEELIDQKYQRCEQQKIQGWITQSNNQKDLDPDLNLLI